MSKIGNYVIDRLEQKQSEDINDIINERNQQ